MTHVPSLSSAHPSPQGGSQCCPPPACAGTGLAARSCPAMSWAASSSPREQPVLPNMNPCSCQIKWRHLTYHNIKLRNRKPHIDSIHACANLFFINTSEIRVLANTWRALGKVSLSPAMLFPWKRWSPGHNTASNSRMFFTSLEAQLCKEL